MSKTAPLLAPIPRPFRDPDHLSKRGVEYWWAPEWVRDLNGTICRIKVVKVNKDAVKLMMVSKTGNLSDIPGSIQEEFKRWHTDRQIDYLLLGATEEDLIKPGWEK